MAGAPPKGILGRSTRLLGLAAGLAQKELKGRFKNLSRLSTQVGQAQDLVRSLGQLKGAAMKAGQLISIELRDYLPPEVVEILQDLQAGAEEVDYSEIRSILNEELGPERLAEFIDIEEAPLASASIGQVHRARLKATGERVVLKIQYRGIARAIRSDLGLLEKIVRGFLTVSFKSIDMQGAFDEIRTILVQETDYEHEAQSLLRYRKHVEGLSGFRVPRVYPELTTSRVLTLSYEEGLSFDDWLKTKPSRDLQDAVGRRLLELYYHEFFVWGFVQTDPNFGNFLFKAGSDEITLLDFGATKEYPPEFRQKYIRLLIAVGDDRYAESIERAIELEMLDARESESARRATYGLLRAIVSMMSRAAQPFDFSDRSYIDGARQKLIHLLKSELRHSPPPRQLLFLHRKLTGIYVLLRALRVRTDISFFDERIRKLVVNLEA